MEPKVLASGCGGLQGHHSSVGFWLTKGARFDPPQGCLLLTKPAGSGPSSTHPQHRVYQRFTPQNTQSKAALNHRLHPCLQAPAGGGHDPLAPRPRTSVPGSVRRGRSWPLAPCFGDGGEAMHAAPMGRRFGRQGLGLARLRCPVRDGHGRERSPRCRPRSPCRAPPVAGDMKRATHGQQRASVYCVACTIPPKWQRGKCIICFFSINVETASILSVFLAVSHSQTVLKCSC